MPPNKDKYIPALNVPKYQSMELGESDSKPTTIQQRHWPLELGIKSILPSKAQTRFVLLPCIHLGHLLLFPEFSADSFSLGQVL